MKLLKALFNFYINASIHVALAVYSLVRITEIYYNLPYNESLDLFIFFGTITGYNFVKYAGVAKLHHRSLTTHLKIIQIFSLFCFILMCFYAGRLKFNTILAFIPLGLLTLFYAVPFLSGFQKNLRSIGFLKIIVVALVWAGTTVLLPMYDLESRELDITLLFVFIQRFLIVFALVLPFDIRDMKYDAISLQTIPKKIGIEKTKKLGFVLLLVCLLLEFIISNDFQSKISFLLVFLLFVFLLMRASENQTKYYSSFIVEGIPIVWWFLLTVF